MNIEYRDGLLFTTIEILYRGESKIIDNIVVDTGASQTLISQDAVDDIGIKVSGEDEVVTSYGIGGKEHAFVKIIDKVKLGDFFIKRNGKRTSYINVYKSRNESRVAQNM